MSDKAKESTVEWALEPMDQFRDVADVISLLGILHQEQTNLFYENGGIEITLPMIDLADYVVDVIWVRTGGSRAIAGCVLCKESNCFNDTYTIADVVLYPEWRNKGLGRNALDLVMRKMQADGVRFVNLNVHADNASARHLYETLGFRPTSIHMTKRLL